MRNVLAAALVLSATYAVPAGAQEQGRDAEAPLAPAAAEAPAVPAPAPTLSTTEAPAAAARLQRQEVREMPQQSATAAQPQRGSFWWVVGAIVIAGVILAVLL